MYECLPNWDYWAIQEDGLLNDLCGLVVDLNMEAFRALDRIYDEEDLRKLYKANEARLLALVPILAAAYSSLRQGSLIVSGYVEATDPDTFEKGFIPLVKITDFREWALRKNIKLPPKFPSHEIIKPIPRKPETILIWIEYRIRQDGLDKNNLPRGYQQRLIKEAQAYGFDEQGSALKRAWKNLGLRNEATF